MQTFRFRLPHLLFATLLWLPCGTRAATAEETATATKPHTHQVDIALDVRAAWHYDRTAGEHTSGFRGEYLNLQIDGSMDKGLSYHFRQRLNKFAEAPSDLFNATDWVYLTWRPGDGRTALSAGKQAVAIGGYEIDKSPVDVYFFSAFCQHIEGYRFAVSAARTSRSGNHTLLAQVCNSPFGGYRSGLYAYNLHWTGRMNKFGTLWSANLLEYERGRYIAYLSLGTSFETGPLRLEVDFMNRTARRQVLLFRDMTLIGEASCHVHPRVKMLVKCSYDVNRTEPSLSPDAPPAPDRSIAPGSEYLFYGAGVEYFPLRGNRNLRLHAVYTNTCNAASERIDNLQIGLRWRVGLYSRR